MNKEKILSEVKSIEEFNKLLEDILIKLKLTDVERMHNNTLIATEKSAMGKRTILFMTTLSVLNGKVLSIKEEIQLIKKYYDIICIITSSKKISKYFQKWIKQELPDKSFIFWSSSDLIIKIDENYPDFWYHSDAFIKPYEEYFVEICSSDSEFRQLLKLGDKYNKLLDIFIEPKIYSFKEDKETEHLRKVTIDKEKIINSGNYVISGEAGTGKSTLLKEIGKQVITKNQNKSKKTIPIYITSSSIVEADYDLSKTYRNILLKTYQQFDLITIESSYNILLLIDSIDGFERVMQKKIIEHIESLYKQLNLRFIITTRNYEYLLNDCSLKDHERTVIENFDLSQVKSFVSNFFRFDLEKADKLWLSLNDNNLLSKIPITPLTLSLISILFEQNQYEVPATITDIYDNFNLFLLGKITVKSNLEFLDISIKERILSLYALEILDSENRLRRNKEDFISFISFFFQNRSITISDELLPELINSMTQGTGILYINENNLIDFKHDYFMEYYASLEIFKQQRGLEDKLIENFTEFNWQNTAIFYSGRTKDMPEFLEKIIVRSNKYVDLKDCLIASSGLGSILQSLWLTDSRIRKDGIITALELLLKAAEKIKSFSAAGVHFFKGIRELDIALMNLSWFFMHFNSITLKDSLGLAFDELYSKLELNKKTIFQNDNMTLLYQLFCISATLSSDRLNKQSNINILFDKEQILTIPLFVILFDAGLDIINPYNIDEMKSNFNIKRRIKKYLDGIQFYINNTSDDLRLTTLDNISPIKNVEIYTEGKTDAEIIQHAHTVLTNSADCYWKITAASKSSTSSCGANELSKFVSNVFPTIAIDSDKSKLIIGIFDNDSKGIQEFNGISRVNFEEVSKRVIKHKDANIYAIKLPIPFSMEQYLQDKQAFNFFEIEHYFPLDFLIKHNMVKETSIPNVYEIIGSKSKFSSLIQKETDLSIFQNFKILFDELDKISNQQTSYC